MEDFTTVLKYAGLASVAIFASLGVATVVTLGRIGYDRVKEMWDEEKSKKNVEIAGSVMDRMAEWKRRQWEEGKAER